MAADVEELVRQLYGMGPITRALGRHAGAELGTQGFPALAVVHRLGPVRPSDVAARLAIDLSVVSRQLTGLVVAGYVVREADPDDRRAHRVRTTPAGAEAVEAVHRRMVLEVADALVGWPAADVEALAQALQRLREDVAAAEGLPAPLPAPTP